MIYTKNEALQTDAVFFDPVRLRTSRTVDENGNIIINPVIPEPATATLNLLALAALATRRRRKYY